MHTPDAATVCAKSEETVATLMNQAAASSGAGSPKASISLAHSAGMAAPAAVTADRGHCRQGPPNGEGAADRLDSA
jgi:hypothetical protein